MNTAISQPVTVALPTLGCKVNRYDSDVLARALLARGYRIVAANQPADVYIVNTCTVTGAAEAKSRKTWRHARQLNARARIILTGCYASLAPDTLAAMDGVDAVVPISAQAGIPDLIAQWLPPAASTGENVPPGLTTSASRTRATVKVQDGCNLRCAFCAVTLARGPVRSRPFATVLAELRDLVAAGTPEIVLTGVRLDAYGLDGGPRLSELVEATRALDIPRLRLSSLEPIGIHPPLIAALAAHPALCHHFHVCLQSGDDEVLRAMRRGYNTERFRRIIGALRAAMPDATFSSDVIVGFPGETDAAFARTCSLVEEMGFIKLHIFKYSARAGTDAAQFSAQVSEALKEARSRELFALAGKLFQRHAVGYVGQRVSVLVERTGARGEGLTTHYLRVRAAFPPASRGTIQPVIVTEIADDFLRAIPA